jgi:hypothetical protein
LVSVCPDEHGEKKVVGFCQETRTYQPTFTEYGGKQYDFSTVSGIYTLKTDDHAVTFSYFYSDNPISSSHKSLHYIDGIVNGGNTAHSGFTLTLHEASNLQVIYLCESAKVKDEECGLPEFGTPSGSPSSEGFDGDDDDDDEVDCSEGPTFAP